ncbi:MAG: NUDIX hydrolase [Candidatus Aminicenantes bacterium]|nr:NUDIX hydrolase [Candidatus Aminicenantes bacterium]
MEKKQPRLAVGAVVFHQGRVLLVKRDNPPGRGSWAIPGGSVRWGETLREAVIRELQEETGLTVRPGEIVDILEIIEPNQQGEIIYHYLIVDFQAEYLRGELHPGDDAAAGGWFTPEEAARLKLTPSTRRLLRKLNFL